MEVNGTESSLNGTEANRTSAPIFTIGTDFITQWQQSSIKATKSCGLLRARVERRRGTKNPGEVYALGIIALAESLVIHFYPKAAGLSSSFGTDLKREAIAPVIKIWKVLPVEAGASWS
ncbi:hypothetical protein KM043_010863 [Ampulex compressa]|nr:hypothetical protein KM043_010863 [Ampulex compressa]